MLKKILVGVGIFLSSWYVEKGIYDNCSYQINRYLPLVEKNLKLTTEEFKKGNYDKVKEFIKERQNLSFNIDKDFGMYQLFLKDGKKINQMLEESLRLEERLHKLK